MRVGCGLRNRDSSYIKWLTDKDFEISLISATSQDPEHLSIHFPSIQFRGQVHLSSSFTPCITWTDQSSDQGGIRQLARQGNARLQWGAFHLPRQHAGRNPVRKRAQFVRSWYLGATPDGKANHVRSAFSPPSSVISRETCLPPM